MELNTALTKDRLPASGNFGASGSAAEHATALLSRTGANRLAAENTKSYAAIRQSSLEELEAASGVDTDQELQRLMLIEQVYAANARMVQTVDEMINTLMRI